MMDLVPYLVIAAILDGIDNLMEIKTTSGGLEDSAAILVPVVDELWVELDRVHRVKSTIASLDTKNLTDSVEVPEGKNQLSHHRVHSRAQPTACHYSRLDARRLEQYVPSGAGAMES